MTVPKNSAPAIVDLLNAAFSNGVKMTLRYPELQKTSSGFMSDEIPKPQNFKPNPMPVEELHPISKATKKK